MVAYLCQGVWRRFSLPFISLAGALYFISSLIYWPRVFLSESPYNILLPGLSSATTSAWVGQPSYQRFLNVNDTLLSVNDAETLNIFATLQYQPSPFPLLHELFVPVIGDDRSKSVYMAYPQNDTIVLFSQGLYESDVKYCVQSGQRTKVLALTNNRIHSNCCVVMITCKRHKNWTFEEPISFHETWKIHKWCMPDIEQ